MPGQDGTGPQGQGPMTGRGLGPCGQGLRRGFGRGFGRSFGRNFGRGIYFRANYPQVSLTEAEEKKILEAELKDMEEDKKEIEKRLKEIK